MFWKRKKGMLEEARETMPRKIYVCEKCNLVYAPDSLFESQIAREEIVGMENEILFHLQPEKHRSLWVLVPYKLA